MKASDNVFPKVELAEDAAPATPSSGQVRLYAKTDGLLYSKDDAGTETLVSGGDAGGAIVKTLIDAKGDLIVGASDNTPAKLTVGTDGYLLKASSAATNGVAWAAQPAVIAFVIDGGGSAITSGTKGFVEVPFACVITAGRLLADQSGSIIVDVWKDTYANYPPTDADSITSAAPLTISAATKSEDSTLTGWTTSIAAGDILAFNVDSATSLTRVTVSLTVRRT